MLGLFFGDCDGISRCGIGDFLGVGNLGWMNLDSVHGIIGIRISVGARGMRRTHLI
jgi:hypothetical protein